jgi:hypothetical protein
MKIEEIKIIFATNWWDGPLSGLCLYNGEKHWFQATEEWYEEDKPYWRRFAVVKLTPEQIVDEEKWHELFKEKVGESLPYVDGVLVRNTEPLKPKEKWHEFYDVYKHNEYCENIVGYFEV